MLPVAQPVDFVGKEMTFVLVQDAWTSPKTQILATRRKHGGIPGTMRENVGQVRLQLMELMPRAIPTQVNSTVAPHLGSVEQGRISVTETAVSNSNKLRQIEQFKCRSSFRF